MSKVRPTTTVTPPSLPSGTGCDLTYVSTLPAARSLSQAWSASGAWGDQVPGMAYLAPSGVWAVTLSAPAAPEPMPNSVRPASGESGAMLARRSPGCWPATRRSRFSR